MSEIAPVKAGQLVTVSEPYRVSDGAWLLPGERIYIVEVREGLTGSARMPMRDRQPTVGIRVRCPASGVDCWLDSERNAVLVQWVAA